MKKIIVEQLAKPLRLDKYLKNIFQDISREKIIFLIKQGKIIIKDKQKIKPGFLLKGGEEIILDLTDFQEKSKTIILKPLMICPEPKVLYENKNFLIIDKPAGITVHPSLNNFHLPTLANWLIKKYPFLSQVGEDKLRPGIVHRLDKETSGVLIIAKNNISFNYFKNLFKQRKIQKKYIALVRGELNKKKGDINLALTRSLKSPIKRKVIFSNLKEKTTKEALTRYKVIKRYIGFTLLEIMLETGRTHQIRVHLASIGFPVVGDKLYGKSKQLTNLNIARHFLHALEISFLDPTQNQIKIKAILPQELKDFLKTLKPKNIKGVA